MNTLRNLSLSALAFLSIASLAFGQASMTSTTLSAAINNKQLVFNVASATGINGPGFPQSQGSIGSSTTPAAITVLVVDREAMRVASVNSTTVTVERGYGGTQQRAHVSGAKVWVGPAAYFGTTPPSGACTSSALTVLPLVVMSPPASTGDLYTCGNGQWAQFGKFETALTYGAQLTTAATIAPTNPIAHITGTTAISTITVPAALPATGGCVVLIPDAIATTTTTGNIAIVSTFVVGKQLSLCFDPTSSKWYPSY